MGGAFRRVSLAVHLEEPIGHLVEDDVRDSVRDETDVDLRVDDETNRMVDGGDDSTSHNLHVSELKPKEECKTYMSEVGEPTPNCTPVPLPGDENPSEVLTLAPASALSAIPKRG
jgi:hypothetical protein